MCVFFIIGFELAIHFKIYEMQSKLQCFLLQRLHISTKYMDAYMLSHHTARCLRNNDFVISFCVWVALVEMFFFIYLFMPDVFDLLDFISHRYPNVSSVKILQKYMNRFPTKFSLLIVFLSNMSNHQRLIWKKRLIFLKTGQRHSQQISSRILWNCWNVFVSGK